jgi:hypothetical protein
MSIANGTYLLFCLGDKIMKKEIITDKYTGRKSIIYSDITEEDRKQLRDDFFKRTMANRKAKKTIKEYLGR